MKSRQRLRIAYRLGIVAFIIIVVELATPMAVFSLYTEVPAPRSIVIFYDDYHKRKDPDFQVTRRTVRPLVAYLDQNGKAIDWMFDSFIFYSYWLYNKKKPTQEYIDQWIKYIFTNRQVTNLDSTVKEVKIALNQRDYQMNVFLTVPVAYNDITVSSVLGNLDNMIQQWNALKPSSLRLVGFYWGFTEDLNSYPTITEIIPEVADYLHSQNLKLLIIPYRNERHSSQRPEYHRLGFDYVVLQPNYAWSADESAWTSVNNALSAGYVEGVEFELPLEVAIPPVKCCGGDWRNNLQIHFQQARANKWYSNLIAVYYHGSTISLMGTDGRSDYRTAYETIYQYLLITRSH